MLPPSVVGATVGETALEGAADWVAPLHATRDTVSTSMSSLRAVLGAPG
jgi:hypothetical protein